LEKRRGALRVGARNQGGAERASGTGRGKRAGTRARHGEISPLRTRLGGVPSRHRAGLGRGDHGDGGTGLVCGGARRARAWAYGAWVIRTARRALDRGIVAVTSSSPGRHVILRSERSEPRSMTGWGPSPSEGRFAATSG